MKKERITHTVDKKVVEDFNRITKLNSINKSALIENLIKKWIKDEMEKRRD
jgi:metal-responsive CopG/Arc/MetJ family transcriptional regulator